jgi:hypothetical protein
MKITIATYYDWEGFDFSEYDTDTMTQGQKEHIAKKLLDWGEDCIVVKELDKTAENLGEDIFALYEERRIKAEETKKKRSDSAKKAWAKRKASVE